MATGREAPRAWAFSRALLHIVTPLARNFLASSRIHNGVAMRISDWRSAGYNVVLGRRQLDGLERHQVEVAEAPDLAAVDVLQKGGAVPDHQGWQ